MIVVFYLVFHLIAILVLMFHWLLIVSDTGPGYVAQTGLKLLSLSNSLTLASHTIFGMCLIFHFFLLNILLFKYMSILAACMHMYHMGAVPRGQKRGTEPLECS